MKSGLIILTYIGLILSIVSCNSTSDRYTDEAGNFSIHFGGEPDTTRETQHFGFGTYSWKVADFQPEEGLNNYYSVAYLDLPKKIMTSDSLRNLMQLFAITQADYAQLYGEDNLSGTFTRTIKGYPGREFIWVIQSDNKGITRRYYLVKNRLYRMEVQYPLTAQHNTDIKAFFNSFKLLKATNNPHPEKKATKPKKKFYARFPGQTQVQYQEIYGEFGPQSMRIELHQSHQNNEPDAYGNVAYSVLCSSIPKKEADRLTEEERKDYLKGTFRNNKMFQSGKILHEGERNLEGKWCYEGMTELSLAGGQTQLVMHVVCLFEDNYIYLIYVASIAGSQNNPEALRFIESFRLNN